MHGVEASHAHADLVQVGLADQQRAGRPKLRDAWRIGRRLPIPVQLQRRTQEREAWKDAESRSLEKEVINALPEER